MKKTLLLLCATSQIFAAPSDTVWKNILRANRRANSKIIRTIVPQADAQQTLAAQPTNGDEHGMLISVQVMVKHSNNLIQD